MLSEYIVIDCKYKILQSIHYINSCPEKSHQQPLSPTDTTIYKPLSNTSTELNTEPLPSSSKTKSKRKYYYLPNLMIWIWMSNIDSLNASTQGMDGSGSNRLTRFSRSNPRIMCLCHLKKYVRGKRVFTITMSLRFWISFMWECHRSKRKMTLKLL